jgi:hypothetical protein
MIFDAFMRKSSHNCPATTLFVKKFGTEYLSCFLLFHGNSSGKIPQRSLRLKRDIFTKYTRTKMAAFGEHSME